MVDKKIKIKKIYFNQDKFLTLLSEKTNIL